MDSHTVMQLDIQHNIETVFEVVCNDPARIVGSGMSGAMTRIRRRADGMDFVAKFLPFTAESSEEIHACIACKHEHVVPVEAVYDTGYLPLGHPLLGVDIADRKRFGHFRQRARRAGRYYVLVMGLMRGGDLFDVLDHHYDALDEAARCSIAGQLAAALHHMHRLGYVHGDIKPENVLLREPHVQGQPVHVCLADFGFTRRAVELPHGYYFTARYASPEMIDSYDHHMAGGEFLPLGTEIDMWALGVVLYACATRMLPFDSDAVTFGRLELAFRKCIRRCAYSVSHLAAVPAAERALIMSLLVVRSLRPSANDVVCMHAAWQHGLTAVGTHSSDVEDVTPFAYAVDAVPDVHLP